MIYAVIELNNGKHFSIKPFPNDRVDVFDLCRNVEKGDIKSFKILRSRPTTSAEG